MLDRYTTRESSAEGFKSKIKSLVKFQTATSKEVVEGSRRRKSGEVHEKCIVVDRGTVLLVRLGFGQTPTPSSTPEQGNGVLTLFL
jgi:hypothetical protein